MGWRHACSMRWDVIRIVASASCSAERARGSWIHYRRLEKASFVWPEVNARGMIELSQAQFAVLTQGLDWRRVRVPDRLAVSIA